MCITIPRAAMLAVELVGAGVYGQGQGQGLSILNEW